MDQRAFSRYVFRNGVALRERIDDLAMRLMLADAPGATPRRSRAGLRSPGKRSRGAHARRAGRRPPVWRGVWWEAGASPDALRDGGWACGCRRRSNGTPPGGPAPCPANAAGAGRRNCSRDFVMEAEEHLDRHRAAVADSGAGPGQCRGHPLAFPRLPHHQGIGGLSGIAEIQEVAHEVETVLDLARNAELADHPGGDRHHSGKRRIT